MEDFIQFDDVDDIGDYKNGKHIFDDDQHILHSKHKIDNIIFKMTDSSHVLYPKKWDYPCSRCGDLFKTIPLLKIHSYNIVKKLWMFENFANCGKICLFASNIENPNTETGLKSELINRFVREFFDPKVKTIGYKPLELLKRRHPFGIMDVDEYYEDGRYTSIIK